PARIGNLGGLGGVVSLELGLSDVIGIQASLSGGIAQQDGADYAHHHSHNAADHGAGADAHGAHHHGEHGDEEHGAQIGTHGHNAHGLALLLGEPHGHQGTDAHKGAGAQAAAHAAHGDEIHGHVHGVTGSDVTQARQDQ